MHPHQYRIFPLLAVAVGLTNMQVNHYVQSQGAEANDSLDVAAYLAGASLLPASNRYLHILS